MKPNFERRAFAADRLIIERSKDKPVIAGHAAVFNQEADLGWFREKILPGAFVASIAEDDIRALFNHDPNFVLGRNTNRTLRLNEDERGLFIENDPPDTQWARDLLTSIERGDISQMSFGFEVVDQRWETKDGVEVRVIEKVKLWDVSPVTFPAYPQTDVALRSHEAWLRKRESDCPACGGCGRTVAMENGQPKILDENCPGCAGSGERQAAPSPDFLAQASARERGLHLIRP